MPLGLLLFFTSLVFASQPACAFADLGVGVTSSSIAVNDVLSPGGGYNLPDIGVANTGDATTTYVPSVKPFRDATASPAPAAWFKIAPTQLTIEPKGIKYLKVTLEPPMDAKPGGYAALVGAKILRTSTGVRLDVGAGAKVTFAVGGKAVGNENRASRDARTASATKPAPTGRWGLVAGAVLAGLVIVGFAARNFDISVRVRRRERK